MSHNVQLSGVRIDDLDLLASVIRDVSKGKAQLMKGARTFRTYSGQPNQCNHSIHIKDSRYDIGLVGNKSDGFSMLADFSMLLHASPFLAKGFKRENLMMIGSSARANFDQECAKWATGALMQEYVLRQAEEQAGRLGRRVQRIEGKNGMIALEVMEN